MKKIIILVNLLTLGMIISFTFDSICKKYFI
jgi:hypothetical protein